MSSCLRLPIQTQHYPASVFALLTEEGKWHARKKAFGNFVTAFENNGACHITQLIDFI